ncbi:uncharacterized protein LOC133308732 [Gastrolobium bilobum]|uniref:uncharacterized protein LOC133308732 n=1 Tax=Gastrolobium bilobum TaxID=150636 RepID=UPI002AAFF490|nr:uncharacterized protein LOC133308732 [Gastrolobium bilobum]
MVEYDRLNFICHNQDQLRAELYKNIIHAWDKGEDATVRIAKCVIIPSSFTGGPRYMAGNYVCTMEFQKHGLPHTHILLFLHPSNKPNNGLDIDRLISAEIPNKKTHLSLFVAVTSYMMHGPCGANNYKSPCMKEGKYTKKFPKGFCSRMIINDDRFPHYKRRDNGRVMKKNGVELDNRFVMPYNAKLLLKYQAHINVEYTCQSSAIKYLFKYIHKGNNRVTAAIHHSDDEIKMFYDCRCNSYCRTNKNITLAEIDKVLQSNRKCLSDYPSMPCITGESLLDMQNRLVLDELLYDRFFCVEEHKRLMSSLTDEQKFVYDKIISAVSVGTWGFFFLYGFGGTGKTFIWNTLSASIRSKGIFVLNVASSGIASLMLPGGRTAHSRFRITIQITEDSTYKTLRDVLRFSDSSFVDKPFGGKVVVFGGDFRQILLVVPHGSRQDIVHATINSSYLWSHCHLLTLTKNMRLSSGSEIHNLMEIKEFFDWLLKVGYSVLGDDVDGESIITIPEELLIKESPDPLSDLIDFVYPDILDHILEPTFFKEHVILTPKLADILNTFSCSGLPDHKLILKVKVSVMLLRDIDQSKGLCNGTRLLITRLGHHVVEATILTGSNIGENVLIPRMTMISSSHSFRVNFQRRQFPLVVSFAITINKSQGQSLSHVGIYLPRPVFTHGQLYVALSRVKSKKRLKILILDDDGCVTNSTFNIVYKEVFHRLL